MRKRVLAVLVFSASFLVCISAIADEDKYAPESDATMAERIRMEAEFTKFLEKTPIVVGIQSKDDYLKSKGTAFFVKNNIVVTVNHVTTPSGNELLISNNWKNAVLLGRVQTRDVAFFKASYLIPQGTVIKFKSAQKIFESFPKGFGKTVPLQEVLVGMKCRRDGAWRIFLGELNRWNPNEKEFSFRVRHGETDGCSGTAIFTYDGYIIGVLRTGFNMNNQALDINEVLAALQIFEK